MAKITKAPVAAAVLFLAIAAGATQSQAGLEIISGESGPAGLVGDPQPAIEKSDNGGKVNAEIVKGKVKARKVSQRVTRRNIRARGRSIQNYAVIDGGK